jgi:hypothetical protein
MNERLGAGWHPLAKRIPYLGRGTALKYTL